MRASTWLRPLLPALAWALLGHAAAWAEPSPHDEPDLPTASAPAAAAAFRAGLAQFDAGAYEAALPMFRQALEISGSPNARLYVGMCLARLGKLVDAHAELTVALRNVAQANDPGGKYATTRAAATTELAALESKVGRVVVTVAEPAEGGTVSINGVVLGADVVARGDPVVVAPGRLVAETRAPGRSGERREVNVVAGRTHELSVTFGDEVEGPAAPADTPVAPSAKGADSEPTGGEIRLGGYAVAALGAASMVAFGICVAVADDKFATLEDECGGQRCTDPSYQEVIDEGRTAGTVANVTLVLGIASLAAGAMMIIFGGPSEEADPAAPSAALSIGPDGAGASFHLRF